MATSVPGRALAGLARGIGGTKLGAVRAGSAAVPRATLRTTSMARQGADARAGPDVRNTKKYDRKIRELKSALLGGYTHDELTDRQKTEWDNVVQSIDQLLELEAREGIASFDEMGQDEAIRDDLWGILPEDENEGPPEPSAEIAALDAFHSETEKDFESHSDPYEFEAYTFEHLSTPNIEAHAAALREHMPVAPAGRPNRAILRFESRQFFEDGAPEQLAHKARKIQLRFYVSDIGLEPAASEKLIALVSTRYDLAQDEVTLTSARFPTAALNKEYLKQTLVKLVSAAKALAKAAEDGGAAGAGNTTTV